MTLRNALSYGERAVAIAETMVGLREEGPNSGPPIERFAGGRQEPWCSHMVATIFRGLGKPLPGDIMPSPERANPLASCRVLWTKLCEAGWALHPRCTPFRGDLFFLSDRGDSDAGKGWHVGFVAAVQGPWLSCVSGNWTDAIARHRLQPDDRRLVGFARVPG